MNDGTNPVMRSDPKARIRMPNVNVQKNTPTGRMRDTSVSSPRVRNPNMRVIQGGRSQAQGMRNAYRPGMSREVPHAVPLKKPAKYYDYSLLCTLILLFGIGLIIIYSGSQYVAMQERGSATYYFRRQLIIGGAGLIAAIIASLFDYKLLGGFMARIAYFVSIGLLGLTFIGGIASHGKTRWLQIAGSTFQPTELAKIGLIIFLAAFISECGTNMNNRENWIRAILYSLLPAVMVASNNISSGAIIAMIAAIMLFVALDNYKVFFGLLLAASAAVAGLRPLIRYYVLELGNTARPDKYWMRRIFAWAVPEIFETDAYQTVQGLYAIGSGGMTGHGLGSSIQKYGAIPEVQNDMIFTIICEEFGFIGAATIIILYIYLLTRIYNIAINARDIFGSMLCTGVMAHIGMQVVLNIAVVTGIIPNTGVTLPFISYGGSAVLFTMLEMGMVLSVAHRINM